MIKVKITVSGSRSSALIAANIAALLVASGARVKLVEGKFRCHAIQGTNVPTQPTCEDLDITLENIGENQL